MAAASGSLFRKVTGLFALVLGVPIMVCSFLRSFCSLKMHRKYLGAELVGLQNYEVELAGLKKCWLEHPLFQKHWFELARLKMQELEPLGFQKQLKELPWPQKQG